MDLEAAQALSASLAQVEKQGSISVMNHELASVIMSARQPSVLTNQLSASNQEAANQGLSIQQSEFPDLRGNVSNVVKQQNGSSQTPNTSVPPPSTSASQAPEPSMANRLAMTRGLSVRSGQLFHTEFPSLNVKTTKRPALPKSSVWSKTTPSTNSSTTKSEAHTACHQAGPSRSKMALQSTVADDFPALQSNKKKTNQLPNQTNDFKQSQSAGNLQSLAMQWIGTTNTDSRRDGGSEEEEDGDDAYSRLGAVGGRWINKKRDDNRNGDVEFTKMENNMVKLTKKNVKNANSSHHPTVTTSNKFEAFEQLKPTPTQNHDKHQQVKHQLPSQQLKDKTTTINEKKNKKNKKNKNKVHHEGKVPSNQPKENEAVPSMNTSANTNNAALSDDDNKKKEGIRTSAANNNSDGSTREGEDSANMFEDADEDFSGNEVKKSVESRDTAGGDGKVGGGEKSIDRLMDGRLKGIIKDDVVYTHLSSHEHFPPLSSMSSSSKLTSSLSSPSVDAEATSNVPRATSSAPTQQHSLSSSSSSSSSVVNTTPQISSSPSAQSLSSSSLVQPGSTSLLQLPTRPSTTMQQSSLPSLSTLSASQQQPAPSSSSSAFRPPPGFQSIVKPPPPGFASMPVQRTPPVLTSAAAATSTTISSISTSTAVLPSEVTNLTSFSTMKDVERDFPKLPSNGPPGFNTRPSNAATTNNVSYNSDKFQRLRQSLIDSCSSYLAESSHSGLFNVIASSVQLLNEGRTTAAIFHQMCLDELTKIVSTSASAATTSLAYDLLSGVLTELLQCVKSFELRSQVHQVHLSRKPPGSDVSGIGGGEDDDDDGADHMRSLLLNKYSAQDLNSTSLLVNTDDDEYDYGSGD
ncbi:hypothetical protein HELRODRAFT_177838 [Helobdella robusta]|uniref:Uncharacterized protein n=1 Tax=Helobdella robusta TaxID=6412 RepID=T1FCC6_HELRO|nr:hypothetical protein HELRODRAFT_177838 [Helobdella robusta]ESN97775.1 hypothetical protein HELRODRAFT_177838 [Helobdella robusta]